MASIHRSKALCSRDEGPQVQGEGGIHIWTQEAIHQHRDNRVSKLHVWRWEEIQGVDAAAMNEEFAWRKWEPENGRPLSSDLPLEWCNNSTGERHHVYNSGGLIRVYRLKPTPTHWRKVEPTVPLPSL